MNSDVGHWNDAEVRLVDMTSAHYASKTGQQQKQRQRTINECCVRTICTSSITNLAIKLRIASTSNSTIRGPHNINISELLTISISSTCK